MNKKKYKKEIKMIRIYKILIIKLTSLQKNNQSYKYKKFKQISIQYMLKIKKKLK